MIVIHGSETYKKSKEHFYEHLSKCELNEILIFRNMQLLISVPISFFFGGGGWCITSVVNPHVVLKMINEKACCGLPSNQVSVICNGKGKCGWLFIVKKPKQCDESKLFGQREMKEKMNPSFSAFISGEGMLSNREMKSESGLTDQSNHLWNLMVWWEVLPAFLKLGVNNPTGIIMLDRNYAQLRVFPAADSVEQCCNFAILRTFWDCSVNFWTFIYIGAVFAFLSHFNWAPHCVWTYEL